MSEINIPHFVARREGSERRQIASFFFFHAFPLLLFPSLRRVQFAVSGSHQPRPCVDARESTESRSGKADAAKRTRASEKKKESAKRRAAWRERRSSSKRRGGEGGQISLPPLLRS